jgi:hypothetical protein
MWQRWVALAICGVPAFWADVCGGLPTSIPKGSDYSNVFQDANRPVSFQLSVRRGEPAFRITVLPLPADTFVNGRGEFGHAGDIEVVRCRDGKRLQLLPFRGWQPLNFAAAYHAEDINFDGYLDFYILTEYAAGWVRKKYWVYDPGTGRFVQNELTRELGGNCLGEGWHGGACHADIRFDPEKHEISTFYLEGCPGDQVEGDRYRVENNRMMLVHKEEVTQTGQGELCTLTISDMIGGSMRVTGVRRFDAHGLPAK